MTMMTAMTAMTAFSEHFSRTSVLIIRRRTRRIYKKACHECHKCHPACNFFGVKASEAKGYRFRLVLTSSSTRTAVIFGSFRRHVRGVKCLIFDRKMTEFKVIKTSGATPKDTYLGYAKVPEVPGDRYMAPSLSQQ